MLDKVRRYIEKYHMIRENDKIVVGVSGGADSVCLLFVLLEIKKEMPFSIYVVHINHKIREEAIEDANYVKLLCNREKIPYYLVEEDVEALAKEEHLSSEEAGRKVRYEAFHRILAEVKGNKIAVAHNKNDRAETVLFNLFRGSSIRGLHGIAPVRDEIIRPLLCVERKEIEQYLQNRGIHYCIDRTNGEDTYTRNRIRNRLLPYIESNISENVVSHISDTAEMVAETEEYLQKMTHVSYEELVNNVDSHTNMRESLWINAKGFKELDGIIQKYLIMKCMDEIAGSRKDITSRHVQDVLELFGKTVNKKINLPYHMVAEREYEAVRIGKERLTVKPLSQIGEKGAKKSKAGYAEESQAEPIEIDLENIRKKTGEIIEIPGLGKAEIRVFPYEQSKGIPEKSYTKWFDYDKIDKSLLVRHRRTGDYLVINEEGNTKTLKTYMIHEKIPREQRDQLYVFAVENHVMWLVGYRISQSYKVDQNTKEILEIHIAGGKEYGRAR